MHRPIYILLLAALALTACDDCGKTPAGPGSDAGDAGDAGSTSEDGSSMAPEGFFEPFDAEILAGWGLHVIARGEDDIYVAGGSPDRGSLLHFDGTSWTVEEIPEGTPLLNWVALFADGQTAVVGNGGTVLWNSGAGWEPMQTPTEEDLWGIWGASPDDVWAVGGRGRAEGQATVLHYDGVDWSPANVPVLERPGVNAFFKVWGTAADNVYIVGQKGGMLRYDGSELMELDVGTAEDLISLWGTGPDDIIVVGGRSNGVMSHWDGTDWTTQNVAPAPGINGVFMTAPGEFWVGGVRGLLRKGTVTADGFDIPRTKPVSEDDVHAVFGVPGYGLMAVGGNFGMVDGPYEGLVLGKTEDWE